MLCIIPRGRYICKHTPCAVRHIPHTLLLNFTSFFGQKIKYDDFDKLSSRIELVLVYNMYMQFCKMIGFLWTAEFMDSGGQNF